MDKHLKEKWITALQSGEFKKGKGYLCQTTEHGTDEYCCLGVLASILGVPRTKFPKFNVYHYDVDTNKGSESYLTGFTTFIPKKYEIPYQVELSEINDSNDTWDKAIEFIEDNF